MAASPETCPNCGAEVPPGARVCPECGSDEQTGWSERATLDRLGVPDTEFDRNEFYRQEFGEGGAENRLKPRSISWWWWLAAALLVGLLLLGWLAR
jgi:hypothetical protein